MPSVSKGKRAIPIAFVADLATRKLRFQKRINGVYKKGWELARLTNATVLLDIQFGDQRYLLDTRDGEPDLDMLPRQLKKIIQATTIGSTQQQQKRRLQSGIDRKPAQSTVPVIETVELQQRDRLSSSDLEEWIQHLMSLEDDSDEEEDVGEDGLERMLDDAVVLDEGGRVPYDRSTA